MPDELSQGQTPPAGAGAAASSSPPSTGRSAPAADALVSVLLVVRNGARWLAECLDGIAAQTVPPARLLIVDLASTDTSAAIAQAHSRVRQVVTDVWTHRMDRPVPMGRAIDVGVGLLGERAGPPAGRADEVDAPGAGTPPEWIWVLHDNCAPGPAALAQLLAAVRTSPSVGIAGPKIVDWDDPRRLVSLGVHVTRSGRRVASPEPGEADQGQHDQRADVLAVRTCGMLLRRDVHADLAGFDPAFEDVGADLDLGWRAQLAGHRVIVVPEAAVRESSAPLGGESPTETRTWDVDGPTRRAARQVALARCSWLALPFLALWVAVSAVAAAVLLLVAKRPRAAWRELGDITVLLRPALLVGARWRGRRTRRLRRSDLRTLFVSPAAAARSTLDHIQDVITPERARAPREAAPTTETGPTSDEAEALGGLPPALPQRLATHPGFLAMATMLVVTALAWRDAIRDGALSPTRTGVAGGELRPVATDSSGLWHAFRDSWHGAGLGSSAESNPHLAVLSGLTWVAELVPGVSESRSSAGLTAAWLLFLAPILSVWSAYLAGRVISASPVARAVVGLSWGASSVVTTAVTDGRLTAALGHVLLPFVLAGFVLAARRHGTYTATFATALATGLLGAFVPPLLAVSSIAALGLLLLGPGTRRLRALVLLLVPPALLGTWVGSVVEDWRHLLSGPGLVSTAEAPEPWRLVLGQAETLVARSTAPTGEALAAVAERPSLALWAAGPLVVLGLLGYGVRSRVRGEGIGLALAGALGLLGLAAALASGRVALGSAETGVGVSETAYLWSGIGLELWTAGLLIGLLVGSRVLLEGVDGRSSLDRSGWHAVGAASLIGLVALPVLVLLGTWGVSGASRTLTVGEATLPAVAVEQSHDPLSNRLLLLRPSAEVVDFVLSGREPGDLLRSLDRPSSADDRPLVDAVARLVGGRSAGELDASELAEWAVGFVQVRADSADPLVRRLDATQGLTRLGASEHGILWKVRPSPASPGGAEAAAPSRLRIVDGEGLQLAVVPTNGPHGAVEEPIPAVPDPASGPRRLVVAEPTEWSQHAVVMLDDRRLQPLAGQSRPTYDLPATGGQLRIDLAAAQPWWRLAQGLVLALVVFMALPFGNRRSRRPSP